jgi:hypothetical protein
VADLREWWATASPRERDAKVAQALGWFMAGQPYSTSWEHAGPLLDALGSEFDWEIRRRPDGVIVTRICRYPAGSAATEFGARCETAPEAIALAFCLANGVPGG